MRWYSFFLIILLPIAACGGGSEPVSTPEDATFTKIERDVALLRQLPLKEPVEMTMMSSKALDEMLMEDLAEIYSGTESREDAVSLWLLGFVEEPDLDLLESQAEYVGTFVGGMYDREEHHVYIIREEVEGGEKVLITEDLTVREQVILSHEIIHSLQHQTFTIDYPEDARIEWTSDRRLAYGALIEGDANYWQRLYYVTNLTSEEKRAWADEVSRLRIDSGERDSAIPEMLLALRRMPYTAGQTFVTYAHNTGGIERINEIYGNIPVSTEQILHPKKYWDEPDDLPVEIELSDLSTTLGTGWEMVDEDVLGEWHLQYLLEHHGSGQSAYQALKGADGWGGDQVQLYQNGDAAVAILATTWDTEEDASEFYAAYLRTLDDFEQSGNLWHDNERHIAATLDRTAVTIVVGTDRDVTIEVTQALIS